MKYSMKKSLIIAGSLLAVVLLIIIIQGFSNVTEGKKSGEVTLSASYTVASGQAVVKVDAKSDNGIKELKYKKGYISSTSAGKWQNSKKITGNRFSVKKKGNYSILATDKKNQKKIGHVSVSLELKAVWIYFDEMYKKATSYSKWKKYIDSTFSTCKTNHMNAVILQVRPFADAMYPSSYYPWSRYATGTAGRNPGFDPLAYAVKAAHAKGLAIHAWINPYRITNSTMKKSSIAANSIALKWIRAKNRNVLKLDGAYYFNPAKKAVRNLVANGVKELVKKYNIDGIHLDDYFYPSLGTANYKKFDYKEYKASGTSKSLVAWRRSNVNKMVRQLYKTVKSADKSCLFGISPAGNLQNLYSSTMYYSAVKTWMRQKGYIDYICPQIYWSFKQKVAPYKRILNEWIKIKRHKSVDLYVGLAGYRAGISKKEAKQLADPEWGTSRTVLKRQVQYARKTKKVDGYCLFSYGSLKSKRAKKEIANLRTVLK